jgi:uncharacterized protein (TIGR00255 family)
MTGYGSAEGPASGGRIQVEVRSVNHRHFAANFKLCTPLQPLELDLRNRVRERIARGHVTLAARWIEAPERATSSRVNLERAKEVVEALSELKEGLNLPGEIDLGFVARQPEVFAGQTAEEIPIDSAEIVQVLDKAVDGLVGMREREGQALATELSGLLDEVDRELSKVEERAPQRLDSERERLRRSVSELMDGRTLDEDRLCQEIAIIADKLDITEEMVRLRTHIGASRSTLESAEPAGRQLAFIGQEMLREINTIGSKANDAAIAQAVIAMKGSVEKFREQIENIE